MPLSETQQQQAREAYTAGTLTPESVATLRQKYPNLLPTEKEADPFPLPQEPDKPWYQRLGEQAQQEFNPFSETNVALTHRVKALLQKGASQSIGQNIGETLERYKLTPEQQRQWLEIGVPTIGAAAFPPAAPLSPYLLSRSPAAFRLLQQYGPQALKALGVGGAAAVGADLANKYVDPTHPTDPLTHGLWTGGGEAVGGLLGEAGGKAGTRVGESFRETPQGQVYRETLEREGGNLPFPGLTTRNPFLRSSSSFFEHMPGGKALRTAREEAQSLIDDALRDSHNLMGQRGRVSTAVEGLQPAIPGKNTLDLEPILRPYFPLGDPNDIRQVPQMVQGRLQEKLTSFQRQVQDGYQRLDRAIEQTPIPWHFGKSRVPHFALEEVLKQPEMVMQRSLFGETQDLLRALDMLPDHITLNTAEDVQRMLQRVMTDTWTHLNDPATQKGPLSQALQYKVLPALGQAKQQLDEWITPLLVDQQPLQREAQKVIENYERGLTIPEASVLGGQTGRLTGTEDPHILAARSILEQPTYVNFQQAHQNRSKLLEISRLPGPNVGNTVAQTGERLATILDRSMEQTADRLGQYSAGGLEPLWRAVNSHYREGAQTWNSDLLMELFKASPDDILTRIVRNERPNDLKALRSVLGEDVWQDVGQMWLARMKEQVTDQVTKQVQPRAMLERLQHLTPAAEKELFPFGLKPLRRDLERTAAMEDLLTSTDPLRTRELLRVVGPTSPEAREIGSVRLSQLAGKHRDLRGQINASGMLEDLNKLGATERELYGTSLAPVKRSLEQASALQRAVTTTDPTLLRTDRRLVDDAELWRAVQSEKLAPGFQIRSAPNQPAMLDGQHLVDHINSLRSQGILDAVFPDKRVVDHLYHLGQTAQALAAHTRDAPYGARHFPMLVEFRQHAAGAAIVIGGYLTGHLPAAGGIYLTMQQLTKAMTNPMVAKWITTGMRTPINARHVGEVAGALIGALSSEGLVEQPQGDLQVIPPNQPR